MNVTAEPSAKYQIIAELGRGGMANVYLALTEGLGGAFSKLVVLKMMHDPLANDQDFVTMFLDEARLAARMNHPNVVQTIEAGVQSGQIFLVMEYLDGQALHRILSRNAKTNEFTLPMQLTVIDDVLSGLHYAHELTDFDRTPLNVVHRDVSPHNVFVTYDGEVKVVDFGIAHAEGRISKTRRGVIKGKATYMAPEQARGEVIDRRTDVFAVGVILAEAMTGKRLWGAMPERDIIRSLTTREVPLTTLSDGNLDEELVVVCKKALAPAPEDRFQTAREMQDALEPVLDRLGGRPSRRAIGRAVTSQFEDRRKLTSELIEQQLALKKRASRDSFETLESLAERHTARGDDVDPVGPTKLVSLEPEPSSDALPDTKSGTRATKSMESEVEESSPTSASPDALSTGRNPDPTRPGGARTRFIGAGLLAAAALTGAVYLARRPAPEITVSLRASPTEARFTIDDGPELPNPHVGRYKRDGREHRVTTRIPGRDIAREQRVRFDDDVSLQIMLKP